MGIIAHCLDALLSNWSHDILSPTVDTGGIRGIFMTARPVLHAQSDTALTMWNTKPKHAVYSVSSWLGYTMLPVVPLTGSHTFEWCMCLQCMSGHSRISAMSCLMVCLLRLAPCRLHAQYSWSHHVPDANRATSVAVFQ